MSYWKHWKYKNLTFWFISIVVLALLFRNDFFHSWLLNLGDYGYLGAFFAGMLFVSTFTVTIGAFILFILTESLNPLEIGAIAGLGAVVGDIAIFHLVRDNIATEIAEIYERVGGKHLTKILHTKYFSWTLPVLGALIIASPLPDELGVSLMGIAKMKTYKFIILSFILNSIGIFLIVSSAALISQ